MDLTYLFVNHRNVNEYLPQLAQFRDNIYMPAFPDENEREPFDEKILPRIQSGEGLQTIIVLAFDNDCMVGGEIMDIYPSCASIHITYLAVEEKMRGKSYGKQILREATAMACQSLDREGNPIEHIFFETENPSLTIDSSYDTDARLLFFAGVGAGLIPIPYAQPPLSEDQDWARNLYLCVLPFTQEEGEYLIGESETTSIAADVVTEFLGDFYEGLGYAEKAEDELAKTAAVLSTLKDEEGEVPIVFFENPQYQIYDTGIASYYRTNEPEHSTIADAACPVFNSYECDLMNYQHQQWENRPFSNHHLTLLENVTVNFPASYNYTSEGSVFHRRTARRKVEVDISVNCSYKKQNGPIPLMKQLVDIVLRPAKEGNHFFSELDMLKFIVCFHFGSKQENVNFDTLLADECLEINTSQCENLPVELRKSYFSFEELIKTILNVDVCEPLGTGVSEFEVSSIKGPLDFETFDEFRQDILSEGPQSNDWNKTLCGLVLGIFDFMRMNGPEIYDTIRPVLDRKYAFAVLCRGHLVSVKMDLEPERVETILMSPYLLIPCSALAFNEDVIVNNWKELEKVSRLEAAFRKNVVRAGEKRKKELRNVKNEFFYDDFYNQSNLLSLSINNVSNSLSEDYLENIFQYPSEKALLEAGSLQRGLASRREDMMEKLGNYKEVAISYREKYTDNVDTIQNLLLFILAVMQVVTAIMQKYVLWITTTIVVVIVCIIGRRQIRRKRKM